MVRLERQDIQGLVMSGHGTMPRATYLLLHIGPQEQGRRGARAWLADLAGRVTVSTGREDERSLHVALTCQGFRRLGVTEDEMTTFPPAFREGMAAENRIRILGDEGTSAPQKWMWGGTGGGAPKPGDGTGARVDDPTEIHLLLLLFAIDDKAFTKVEADERRRLSDCGLTIVQQLTPERLPGPQSKGRFGLEHFGFADGMSQPVIRGSGQEAKLSGDDATRNVINAGEFVLGYPNGYGKLTPWPKLSGVAGGDTFDRNGTFLVFRHLEQDVAGFRVFLRNKARASDGATAAEADAFLGAKLVGRWPSGAPLVKSQHRDDPDLGTDDSFGYAAWDPDGERCPLGSHIRRTNPRDSLHKNPVKALELANLHRVLRRGRVYGPGLKDGELVDDGKERGLFFLCLNANIERQFEFIQHTWCSNPKFAERYDEIDPLIGNQPDGGGNLTIQEAPIRRRLVGIPTFVTTKGGAYFFLPGASAIRQLASMTG